MSKLLFYVFDVFFKRRNVTDGWCTELLSISLSRISVVTHDKKENENYYHTFSVSENRIFAQFVIKLRPRPTYNELCRPNYIVRSRRMC